MLLCLTCYICHLERKCLYSRNRVWKKKQSTLFKFGFSQTINDRETIDNIVANQLKNSKNFQGWNGLFLRIFHTSPLTDVSYKKECAGKRGGGIVILFCFLVHFDFLLSCLPWTYVREWNAKDKLGPGV